MRYCDAAQAEELIRELRHQLQKMTTELAWVERHVTGTGGGQARALRMEATGLRRDIRQAQSLIDRLQRRYLSGDGKSGTGNSQFAYHAPRQDVPKHQSSSTFAGLTGWDRGGDRP